MPDEIVIEKRNKGDTFVESIGVDVKISNLKFIQHDAIEGIVCEFIIKHCSSASYGTVQKYSPPGPPPPNTICSVTVWSFSGLHRDLNS